MASTQIVMPTTEHTIVVVGGNTTVEEAAPFIVAGRTVITVDQLNQVLIGGGDHWLLTRRKRTGK